METSKLGGRSQTKFLHSPDASTANVLLRFRNQQVTVQVGSPVPKSFENSATEHAFEHHDHNI